MALTASPLRTSTTPSNDAEEQAKADEEAEVAAAEALVETTLEMVDAKKCGLCYEWFEAEQVRWDAEPYCYVCKDVEACTARRPGAQGRKRARREGARAAMPACHVTPNC